MTQAFPQGRVPWKFAPVLPCKCMRNSAMQMYGPASMHIRTTELGFNLRFDTLPPTNMAGRSPEEETDLPGTLPQMLC